MLHIQMVNNIVYRKLGKDKYKLEEPIKIMPTKNFLTEEEFELLYKVFNGGFKIKLESENNESNRFIK